MSSKDSNLATNKDQVLWLQWTGGAGAMLVLLVTGMMIGWTSPYIAQLTAIGSPLPITLYEASWVASLLTLGRFFGSIPGAVCLSYLGGRKTLIIIGIPCLISWICIILADSVTWLYVGRLLSGMGLGMAFSSFPLYLGEVSSAEIRGTLVSFAISGLSIGILLGNVIGAYVSMAVFAYVSLIPTIMFILIFIWLPESPHFLIRNERIEDAKIAIAKYNPKVNAEFEVRSLQDFIKTSGSARFVDRLSEFNIPANRKAGFIAIMLFMFMQLNGVNTVLLYMETIITDGGLTVIRPATLVIIAGATGNITGLLAIYLADRCGRKILLIISSAGVAASLIALGAHFTLLKDGFSPDKLQWLLISSLIFYEGFVFIGLCPVPSMVVSELFAPNIKSIAACFGSLSVGLFSFLGSKTYQPLIDLVGLDYFLWLNSILMMIAMIFSLEVVPETKGKSLQEIQHLLHNKYVAVGENVSPLRYDTNEVNGTGPDSKLTKFHLK